MLYTQYKAFSATFCCSVLATLNCGWVHCCISCQSAWNFPYIQWKMTQTTALSSLRILPQVWVCMAFKIPRSLSGNFSSVWTGLKKTKYQGGNTFVFCDTICPVKLSWGLMDKTVHRIEKELLSQSEIIPEIGLRLMVSTLYIKQGWHPQDH